MVILHFHDLNKKKKTKCFFVFSDDSRFSLSIRDYDKLEHEVSSYQYYQCSLTLSVEYGFCVSDLKSVLWDFEWILWICRFDSGFGYSLQYLRFWVNTWIFCFLILGWVILCNIRVSGHCLIHRLTIVRWCLRDST